MKLRIMNHDGDTQVTVEDDRELAEELFEKALGEGKVAYTVPEGNGPGTVVRELPPSGTAVDVYVRPQMVGG